MFVKHALYNFQLRSLVFSNENKIGVIEVSKFHSITALRVALFVIQWADTNCCFVIPVRENNNKRNLKTLKCMLKEHVYEENFDHTVCSKKTYPRRLNVDSLQNICWIIAISISNESSHWDLFKNINFIPGKFLPDLLFKKVTGRKLISLLKINRAERRVGWNIIF